MAEAKAVKDQQLRELEQKNKDEIMRVSEEASKEIEFMKTMHDEAMKITNLQMRDLEKQQENYIKIIEKKNYEASYPIPTALANHQEENPKAFYIQILGCRGAGKSTFLNRFFHKTELRKSSNSRVLEVNDSITLKRTII